MDKATLRQEMLARRLAVDAEERFNSETLLLRKALNYLFKTPFESVAGYAAIRGEIDVFPLLEILHDHHKTLCLPVMQPGSKVLQFYQWQPGDSLISNRYGIPEPAPDSPEIVPEILLVPLLAYDKARHRLGYGGGYYDATLAALPEARALGCGWRWQEVKKLPAEPQDRPLEKIIAV